MTKRFVVMQLAIILALFQAATVFAGNPDTGPGCGLGKLAWGDFKGQKQIAPQVMMATTNGTFGSQTFGISFGTSGCTSDGVIMRTELVNAFASATLENLQHEMAQGHGEHLTSLATLMGIPTEHQAEFFTLTQEKYASLMQSGETTAVAMLKALHEVVESHPVLAQVSMNR
ncbi:MAG: DUF3015 domain-containing protein [Nitrospirales bacterium]|nr:DUF3015 domain-containing protein [Nitrospirales bacterium]